MSNNKELFIKFLEQYTIFCNGVNRFGDAIFSKEINDYSLLDSDWGQASDELFDITLRILFSDEGADFVSDWYFKCALFPDDFNSKEIKTSEDLWNYLLKHKELYFKNVE